MIAGGMEAHFLKLGRWHLMCPTVEDMRMSAARERNCNIPRIWNGKWKTHDTQSSTAPDRRYHVYCASVIDMQYCIDSIDFVDCNNNNMAGLHACDVYTNDVYACGGITNGRSWVGHSGRFHRLATLSFVKLLLCVQSLWQTHRSGRELGRVALPIVQKQH